VTSLFWTGVLVVGLGVGVLIVAPLAQSCVTGSDYRVCETIGTVVLNVVGLVLIAAGAVVLAVGRRHKIAA
jgi:hypothetical protein